MKIAIIGGRFKNTTQLTRIARDAGCQLEVHEGHLHGSRVGEIRNLVARSELALIVTSINSHGAMHVAKESAKQYGVPTLLLRQLGAARFRTLVEAIERRADFLSTELTNFDEEYDSAASTRTSRAIVANKGDAAYQRQQPQRWRRHAA
jgi:hypothetical protein